MCGYSLSRCVVQVAAAVECIAKPVLDLLVRTRVPTMRTTALFTLARCCHCPDTAEYALRAF